MALVADQFDTFPSSVSAPLSTTANLADAAKQATQALKYVAYTTQEVGELLHRKHDRVMKRIGAISEEIESLKSEVMDNIAHQRERRIQLSEIEDDLQHAQLLGNGTIVESLYDELHAMKEETKREESLYRMLCKTVRSRKEAKKQFMKERLAVEEDIRTFAQKQKLVQTLLATCSKQNASIHFTMENSENHSDCGIEDTDDDEDHDNGNLSGDGSSSDSFPENSLFDTPPLRALSPPLRAMSPLARSSAPRSAPMTINRKEKMQKSASLQESRSLSPIRNWSRVRSWSNDCIQPLPPRESVQNRPRQSLSVHFASPVLTCSTIKTNDEELDRELESLDLTHYLNSVQEIAPVISAPTIPAVPSSPIKEEEVPAVTALLSQETEDNSTSTPPLPEPATQEELLSAQVKEEDSTEPCAVGAAA